MDFKSMDNYHCVGTKHAKTLQKPQLLQLQKPQFSKGCK